MIELPGGAAAPGRARDWLRSCLGRETIGISHDDAALIVSELVTNSVVHARVDASQLLRVTVAALTSRWRITIRDPGSATEPHICAAGAQVPGGVGLRLVDRLCADWGTFRDPDGGTHVWCDLPGAPPA